MNIVVSKIVSLFAGHKTNKHKKDKELTLHVSRHIFTNLSLPFSNYPLIAFIINLYSVV